MTAADKKAIKDHELEMRGLPTYNEYKNSKSY